MKPPIASVKWNGGGWADAPVRPAGQPTAFEYQARRLNLLTFEEQKESRALRLWARKNFRSRYVPEELLKHWHLEMLNLGRVPGDDF